MILNPWLSWFRYFTQTQTLLTCPPTQQRTAPQSYTVFSQLTTPNFLNSSHHTPHPLPTPSPFPPHPSFNPSPHPLPCPRPLLRRLPHQIPNRPQESQHIYNLPHQPRHGVFFNLFVVAGSVEAHKALNVVEIDCEKDELEDDVDQIWHFGKGLGLVV